LVLDLPIISNTIIIGVLAIQFVFIVSLRPYQSNLRPALNMGIGILIQAVFLGADFMGMQ